MTTPPVFLINLDRNPERLETARAALAPVGIVPERVAAVDGRALPPGQLAQIEAAAMVAIGRALSPGEVGCFLSHLEAASPAVLVVDMVEQGLDEPSQEALIAHLRRRGSAARPLFLMTRSSAILDLAAMGPDEAIILCPANHSPPSRVTPHPGAPGYEAVATSWRARPCGRGPRE